ncbi:MAG: High-affnity carbon uptake protein Hat/HatR [Bacteroidota bacterium]
MPEKDYSVKGGFNPFPGLRPFTPEESDLFFGREGQSGEVFKKLKQNRFVTVIGASGSGKSSLVYSGVMPYLVDTEGKDIKKWQVINMHPGDKPMANLVSMLTSLIPPERQKELDRTIIESILKKDEKGLVNAIDKLNVFKDGKTLLIIDQFEEIFRYKTVTREAMSKEDNRHFMDLLVSAVKDPSSGIFVIMTMRSDYIGECAHFQGLTELINNSNYLVPHMTEKDYRRAIRGPVEYAGASIESELVDLLVRDIGERTDQLPVLQHVLMRTWENWQSMGMPDKPISTANYNAIGGMSEAMSRHADEAYEELNAREKEICEALFRTITEKGADNKGVRQPTRLGTIAAIARCSEAELIKVIDKFRSSGRSFITPREGVEINGDTIIDISHESLMRVWDRLSEWVDKEAESKQMYLKLSEAAAMFQEGKTSLWRPPDLQLALSWRKENKPTLTWAERLNPAFERAMVYLRTSEKEYNEEEEYRIKAQKRRLRRSRVSAIILGSAAVVAVFLMLYAFVKQVEAEKNRQLAEEQEKQATLQKQMAENRAELALRNAKEAQENEAVILEDLTEARINTLEAMRQREIAYERAREAREQEVLAQANADSARMNEEEALKLRMVSVGKSMAVRSVQMTGRGDIQVLLAYQAYLFNRRNGGIENDADIYMGLYNVAKEYGRIQYRTFDGHEERVHSIVFLPGTQQFFSSGSDGKILRWNIQDNEQGPSRVFEGDEIMEVLTTSADGRLLACGSNRSLIRIIPASGQGEIYELTGHTGTIKSLVFTPDNDKLVSTGVDGQVIMWDIKNREPSLLMSAEEAINSVDVSHSGRYIVAVSDSGLIHLWDMDNNMDLNTVQAGNGPIEVVRFKDNITYAVGYYNGLIEFRNVESKHLAESVKAHSQRITDIYFNEDLKQMATSSYDGLVKIWNHEDLTQPPVSLEDNNGRVYSVAVSADGKFLLSGSQGNNTGKNLIARVTHVDYLAVNMCQLTSRNFTEEEWWRYVGRDIKYQQTCDPDDLKIDAKQIKGD